MRRLSLLLLALSLAGCSPDPTISMRPIGKTSGRFNVEQVDVFTDNLAYNGKRGIYLITDTANGKEYVGISGVGVSSLGTHPVGKTWVGDER